jgi:ComF family protein
LGEVLAQPLGDLLINNPWKIDLILPVPLDRQRQQERGYNQAALLAKPVSWSSTIPYSDQALLKPKLTRHQVGLSLGERKVNLAGAFKAQEEIVRGLNIVVVDDVMTTGATINACAQALIEGGANQVYGLTLARSLQTFGD